MKLGKMKGYRWRIINIKKIVSLSKINEKFVKEGIQNIYTAVSLLQKVNRD